MMDMYFTPSEETAEILKEVAKSLGITLEKPKETVKTDIWYS